MAAAAPPQGQVWEMHPQYNDHHRPFKNQYELKEELGKGGFGTVRRCIYREAPNVPQREFAAKINNTPEKAREQRKERDICARLSEINAILGTHQFPSPHIVNIFDSLEEGDIVYNIYEIASGGDLSDVLAKKEFFTPLEAADAIRQILWGVNHMHERGYIHRDLKPQNILIQSKNVMVYKVADFGLSRARHLDPGSGMFVRFAHGICGTLQYRPPEATAQAQTAGSPTRDYDIDFDIWSCGVILYQLLAGYPPFWEDSDVETENKIFQRNIEFPDPEWTNLTQARSMIETMLDDISRRATYADLVGHGFYSLNYNAANPIPVAPPPNVWADFQTRRDLKRQLLYGHWGIPAPPPLPPAP